MGLVGHARPPASHFFEQPLYGDAATTHTLVKIQHIFRERAVRRRVRAADVSAHAIRRVSVQAVRVAVRVVHVIFQPS